MITPCPVFRSQFSSIQHQWEKQVRGKQSKAGPCGTFAIFAIELEHKIFFILLYVPLPGYKSHFCLKIECLGICWNLRLILKATSILNHFQCLKKLSKLSGTLEIVASTIKETESPHKKLLKSVREVNTPFQLRDPKGSWGMINWVYCTIYFYNWKMCLS